MLSSLSFRITRYAWFAPLLLAIVALVMHHSALDAFWRFDDGWHLGFAACYAPWEYFLIPGITREISYANLTPWNPLTYDVNLALFGLNPIGYYAHQLVSLWLAAWMSFLLLRLWLGLGWAVLGAVLFLAGAPTVHIAHELMTGHYLEGLIFACVAIYGFVHAIRGNGRHWLILGVLGYVLACTCKEVYVPIPVLLLALPEGDWKKRFRFAVPFLTVTFLYFCWRAAVLGNVVGGYYHESHVGFSLSAILLTYVKLPTLLFRPNFIGYLALLAFAMLLFLNTTRRGWLLVIVAAAVALLPLAPLTISVGVLASDRYLFTLWWAVALGVAVFASRDGRPLGRTLCIVLTALIGVAAIQAGRAETKAEQAFSKTSEALYHAFNSALLMNTPNDAILPPLDIPGETAQFFYSGFLAAVSRCGVPKPHPKLLSSVEAIAAIDPEKVHVYRYDTACSCMKDVSSTVPELLSTLPWKRENRTLRTVYLPPPYRPRRDQVRITDANAHGGVVESINVVGETIEITGWVRLRDDEPIQGISFFVPAIPVKQSLVSIERPDIAKHLNNPRYVGAGFRATLQFSDSASAAYAAAYLCAVKMAGGSFAPIENPSNQECSILFQQYP
jgi:hypothetical protein